MSPKNVEPWHIAVTIPTFCPDLVASSYAENIMKLPKKLSIPQT